MATKLMVCLVLIAASTAVPLREDNGWNEYDNSQCAKDCTAYPTKFDYQPSQTYVYEYKAETETAIAGASENTARINIETLANIEVINSCEFALRLQNVKVYHSEPFSNSMKRAERSEDFQRDLTENTLRFSFNDGVIRDVCPSTEEKSWVLNFKRGLLSAFQNSQRDLKKDENVKEIDVSGECEAVYNKTGGGMWGSSIKLTKSKNLLSCSGHSDLKSAIPMVPYNVPSEIQSLPIMKSTHDCDYTISSSKILQSAVCKESHIFAPFSNHKSGASTTVKQSLTFKVVKSGVETRKDSIEARSSLLFQHVNGIKKVENGQQAAEEKLKEICEQTKYDIRPETPRLFTELVQIVKALDTLELNSLMNMIKNKKLCTQNDRAKKFLLDTLPVAGTAAAVDMMATMINNDEINDLEKQVWLTSLTLISEPTEDMFPAILKLLIGESGEQALLPASALMNSICSKNFDCERSYGFNMIVNKMNEDIDSYCYNNVPKIMETLRAIGNIGYGTPFLNKLKTCLDSSYSPLEAKVAAADAYRRFACAEDEESGPLFQVFESEGVDSELRIMSFLSLMRCPTEPVVRKIIHQLSQEEDIHVGTFVSTHLESLKATSDPHKQDLASQISENYIRKFDHSGLRTSRSFESSTLLNRLNMGYVAGGDLVWSETSMVPRSVRLNLTMELFGKSINLFEVGARMDGVEKFAEKYLKAGGYFPINEASPDDLEAFVFARMFGNELFFKHVKGSEEYKKFDSLLETTWKTFLDNLSQKYDYRFSHSQQLFDGSLIIPTAIGLPVNLTINSSVTVIADASGKVELAGLMQRSKPVAISTNVAASAGLEVTGSMQVDAMIYKTGVRMRNTLHSSINFKSNLMVKDRQIVDFEIESPEKSQEIFDARSQFFIIHDYFEKEQEMVRDNRVQFQDCTGDKFSKITGLEVCGVLEYPHSKLNDLVPYFPFTGPARASLVLNKKDTHRAYKIFAKWIRNSKRFEAQLQVDTPGSQVDRHISMDVSVGYKQNPHIDITLVSPWKKFVLSGKAAMNPDIASLTGSISIDDKLLYRILSEVKKSKKGKQHRFMPFLEIETNKERINVLSGSILYDEKQEINVHLDIKDFEQEEYTFDHSLVNRPQEKRFLLSMGEKDKKPYMMRIGTSFEKTKIRNNVQLKIEPEIFIQTNRGEILSFKSQGNYNSKPVRLSGAITLNAIRLNKPVIFKVDFFKKQHSYPITVKLFSSPLSGDLRGNVVIRKKSYSTAMTLSFKTDSLKEAITWNGKFLDRSKNTFSQFKLNSNLKFKKHGDYNTQTMLEISHKKKSAVSMTVFYGKKARNKNKMVKLAASVNVPMKSLEKGEINAELSAKVPEKDVDIRTTIKQSHTPKKFDSEISLYLDPLVKTPTIKGHVLLQNRGRSMYNMIGEGNLEAYGQKYNIRSDIIQKTKKRFENSLSYSSNDEKKHEMINVYKTGDDNYAYSTVLVSDQLSKPVTIELSGNIKKPTDFFVKAAIKEENTELYSIDALCKMEEYVAGKWHLMLIKPNRKVKANANFNRVNDRIKTDFLLNWDVDEKDKPTPEIHFNGHFTHTSQPDLLLLRSNVKVTTPFENLKKFGTNLMLKKSKSELNSNGRIAWGGVQQFSTDLNAKLPLSFEKASVSLQAKTPFKNYRDVSVEVDHNLDSSISTVLKGKYKKEEYKLSINGKKEVNDYSRIVNGEIKLETPYTSMRQMSINIDHSDDKKDIKNIIKFNNDGTVYKSELRSSNPYDKSNKEKTGLLTFTTPKKLSETSFALKDINGRQQFEASFNVGKGKRNQMNVELVTSYLDLMHFGFSVDVKSPIKASKKFGIEFEHQLDEKDLQFKAIVSKNRAKTGYDVKLSNKMNVFSSDVLLLLSPAYEKDVRFVSRVALDTYPATISSQISWAQHKIIDFTGSYKVKTIDDLDFNFKLTTPFEDFENMNLIASNSVKKGLQVSHVNFGWDVKKNIDFEVQFKNEDKEKLIRINLKTPFTPIQSLESSVIFDGKRNFGKTELELIVTPDDKFSASTFMRIKDDGFRGKVDIATPILRFKKIEGSIETKTQGDNHSILIKLNKQRENLIDIDIQAQVKKDVFDSTVKMQGKALEIVAKAYDGMIVSVKGRGRASDFVPNKLHTVKGNVIQTVISKLKMEGAKKMKVDALFTANYGNHQLVRSLNVHKIGEDWRDIDVAMTFTSDKESITTTFVSKLKQDIQLKAILSGKISKKSEDKFGFELSHSSDSSYIDSKFKFYYPETTGTDPTLFYDFFILGTEQIDLKAGHLSFNDKQYKIRVYHKGQENSVHYSVVKQGSRTGNNDKDLLIFALKQDKNEITSSLNIEDQEIFSMNGTYTKLNNDNLKGKLKTSFGDFKCNIELDDGTAHYECNVDQELILLGSTTTKYESQSDFEFAVTIDQVLLFKPKLELQVARQDRDEKRIYVHLAAADDGANKVIFERKEDSYGNLPINFEARYNWLDLPTDVLVIKAEGKEEVMSGNIKTMKNNEVMLDVDYIIDPKTEKLSLVVTKPQEMEYNYFKDQDDHELYLNWDKSDPFANALIKASVKDNSNSYKTDKSQTLKFRCPRNSITLEHSFIATPVNMQSIGKIMLNRDSNKQLSYDLSLKDLSNRRKNLYTGDLKVKIPTRTLLLSGYAKDDSGAREAQTMFKWDVENDSDKQVGVRGKLDKGEGTQADVSIILPKDAHIDSKFVYNKGNTILEGKTEIVYSDDVSKTLTLFSKLENIPGQSSYFYTTERQNYSVQFGLSHPDSRVDMKVASHFGIDEEQMTSSINIDYLNARRQMKNFDLFLQINKLRKEINLIANNPIKSFGFGGVVISHDPLEWKASMTVDQEERKHAHFKVSPDHQRFDLDWKNNDYECVYSAYYPNKTAFLIERQQRVFGELEPEYKALVQLSSPDMLQATFNWRSGLTKEARDRFFDELELVFTDLKEMGDGVVSSFEREVTEKFKDISGSIFEDMRSTIDSVEQEVRLLEKDIDEINKDFKTGVNLCTTVLQSEELINIEFSSFYNFLRSLSKDLKDLQNTPTKEVYSSLGKKIIKLEQSVLGTYFLDFLQNLSEVDARRFRKFWYTLDEFAEESLDPQPMFDNLNAVVKDFMDKKISAEVTKKIILKSKAYARLRSVLIGLKQTVMDSAIGEQIVDTVVENVKFHLGDPSTMDFTMLRKVEDNMQVAVDYSINLLSDVVEEELKENMASIYHFTRNPITDFRPKDGVLEVQIPLLLSFERIDKMPTSNKLSEKLVDLVFPKHLKMLWQQ